MSIDVSTLNENQRQAVQWNDGPLLVLAGPGSGKTRVLTYRIARMIQQSPKERFRILGLTFTNKAAGEMRERIEQLVPDASSRTLLTTFHSFTAELLRQHGHHIGLKPDFTILAQQADRESVLEEVIDAVGASDDYTAERLLPLISRLLDMNIATEAASESLQIGGVSDHERLGAMYASYRQCLVDRNRLDFGALIAEAIRLLESSPGIRKQIQRIYPFVCVDEFQDTNFSQYQVLRQLINSSTRNVFVVADDDQIIYQWNGASPERLQDLRDEFDMSVIQLPENYRCPPEVIRIANLLIANNLGRSEGKEQLTAHKGASATSCIRVMQFGSLDQEADWITTDIKSRTDADRARCAVLARTKKVLDVIIRSLEAAGVSSYLSVRKDEFVTPAMRWLHSMLRLANSRQDREQLRRACKAFYTLEGINLNVRDVISGASTEDGDYLRAWRKAVLSRVDDMDANTKSKIDTGISTLADQLDFRSFMRVSFEWLDEKSTTGDEAEQHDDEYMNEKTVWSQLVGDIDRQYGTEAVTLHLLLQELDMRSKAPIPQKGAVPCFTIHASKGMEFGHVYLAALVEDQLPSWLAIKKGKDSKEIQEERRNCFVAVTRTQESLTMTHSQQVFGWPKQPSRFLREMELVE